jgi:hypothetical protein
MSKIKINLFCNDTLIPSSSSFNKTKYVEWVTDGQGKANFYVNLHCLDVFKDTSDLPKYVWLMESRNIIPQIYKFFEDNKEFAASRCDGIFTCDKELAKNDGFFYAISNAVPWIVNRKIYEKTKLVSMISSNKAYTSGHRNRLEYVEKFKNDVDLYGRGFVDINCKEDGLVDYMFSINIENAVYDTYFTEKLTDCFATGTIPIFYGSKGVIEYFNEDGIIFLDDNFEVSSLTKDLYYSKMDAIKDNFERIKKFPIAEDYIYKNYLLSL